VWHLPFSFAVAEVREGLGDVARPLHTAFPILYARHGTSLTLGQAVHMADGGLVDEATPAVSALGNVGQAMREMLLFEDRDQAKQLVASFPVPWLDAARQHQLQLVSILKQQQQQQAGSSWACSPPFASAGLVSSTG
jgi:hypothetical protein